VHPRESRESVRARERYSREREKTRASGCASENQRESMREIKTESAHGREGEGECGNPRKIETERAKEIYVYINILLSRV